MQTPQPAQAGPERVLFEGNPAVLPTIWHWLVAILTVGIAALVFWIKQKSHHYRITTERIVVERGVFSKRMDQLDLSRIKDYIVERPFSQRLAGTGNIVLNTMDPTDPNMRLEGLKTDVRALYEELRKATETQKRLQGVRVVDYE
jgi:uncharacterized membrane protein YdbT with pleckstrin-like domain